MACAPGKITFSWRLSSPLRGRIHAGQADGSRTLWKQKLCQQQSPWLKGQIRWVAGRAIRFWDGAIPEADTADSYLQPPDFLQTKSIKDLSQRIAVARDLVHTIVT